MNTEYLWCCPNCLSLYRIVGKCDCQEKPIQEPLPNLKRNDIACERIENAQRQGRLIA